MSKQSVPTSGGTSGATASLHRADAKSTYVNGIPFASKELVRHERKVDPLSEDYEGLRSPDLERNEELQAQSKDALIRGDWASLEKLCRQRLEIVPGSVMALKHLAQANYELGLRSNASRRFNEAEKYLLESLDWHLEHSGPKSDAVGRLMLELGRSSLGNASRKLAMERISNARSILEMNGLVAAVEECDSELAKLR